MTNIAKFAIISLPVKVYNYTFCTFSCFNHRTYMFCNTKYEVQPLGGGGGGGISMQCPLILDHNAITLLVIVSSDVDAKHYTRACPCTLLYEQDIIIIIYVTRSMKNDHMQ